MSTKQKNAFVDKKMVSRAIQDSFVKCDPKIQVKNPVMTPRSSYTIGAKLIGGNGLTVKVYSSKNTVAKVTRVSSKEYKVTGLKVGTANIMFDIYDKSNKKLAHTYVKITVKRGIKPYGSASKRVVKF